MIFTEAVYSLLQGTWCCLLPKMEIWPRWIPVQIHLNSSGHRHNTLERGVSRCDFCHTHLLVHSITRLLGHSDWSSSLLYIESKCHLKQSLLQITHGLELVLLRHVGLYGWAVRKNPLTTRAKIKVWVLLGALSDVLEMGWISARHKT